MINPPTEYIHFNGVDVIVAQENNAPAPEIKPIINISMIIQMTFFFIVTS